MEKSNKIDKKFGGTIRNWQLHTIVKADDEEGMTRCRQHAPDMMTENAYIFTGTVEEDPTGRFEIDWKFKSSLVVNVDRENGIIETLNTIYKVKDEGNDYTGGDLGPAAMGIYF